MEEIELTKHSQIDFPVVGIGASAGGFEAVTTMFSKVEPELGMAYVLVMHLDPNHESLMVELLSRKTQVEVRQIKDGDEVKMNCLHVIPPGYSLSLNGPKFRLERFEEPRGLRRPIDLFFGSLAKVQGENCACVVLSGTGADGTAGLRIGKDLGSVIAVQTPGEARYDGMPFSAISTNLIDFTLPADEIIPRLYAYFNGWDEPDLPDSEDSKGSVSQVFEIVRKASGNDFSGYKPSMLHRRMKRRMQVKDLTDFAKYVDLLRGDTAEQYELAQDFSINVTSFFRDREKFEIMRKQVLVPMIQDKTASSEIRIWVPGCSSGQEAYSIAMMVDQTCEELGRRPLIQIFATDIDEEMLARARSGEYLTTEYEDLPKFYQDRYTVSRDGNFEISRKIREMVRFSYHNLIQDPPFSKIDFISCRNLLIYFGEGLQTELFPVFHFSLNPGGYLFLGTSESISRQNDLFSIIDQRSRIFRRLETGKRVNLNLPLGRSGIKRAKSSQRMSEERDFPQFTSMQSSHDEIYQEYAPPFIRVASDGRIIGSSGDLGLFLLARPGEERDLFSLLRPGIREFAVSLLSDAAKAEKRLAVEDVEVHTSFGTVMTDIIAHPMSDNTVSLIFVVQEPLKPTIKKYAVEPISVDKRVSDLQEQLSLTQLQLKAKVEEIETANEELKSSNEEMMSMNEELQSANEELSTANEELKNKIDELTLANADLDNFLSSADLAMVVVDRSLRIRHVTGAATDILPIRHTDRGRFLTEFNLSFGLDSVSQKILLVMETSQPFAQTTAVDVQGRSFFLRITPFFYKDGAIEGAMITLTDISKEIALRHDLSLESERAMLAMRAGRMGMAEIDVESGDVTVDEVLAQQFELSKPGVVTMEELTANFVPEDIPIVQDNLTKASENDEEYEFDFRVKLPDGGIRWVRTLGAPYTSRTGRKKVIGPTIDITDVTNYRERELIIREMSHRIKNLFAVISSLVSTARGYDDPKKMSSDLVGKISSLGRVYDLARKKVTLDGVDLERLLRSVIDPHASSQTIEVYGPSLVVNNDMLNTFTLIVHELTTNAFKYGALSHERGHLKVAWTKDETNLTTLTWSETVPDFVMPIEKHGFGSRLLEGAAEQLEGSIHQRFTENGAQIELTAKLFERVHDEAGK